MDHKNFVSSTQQKEYILVKVENPMIHNTHDEGRYTTYDVSLQTNSPSFALKNSVVLRRYSDFVWLKRVLAKTTEVKPPSLPMGKVFGLFSPALLQERQKLLTNFIMQIVQETQFLSNSALHLFLQTNLKRKQMDTMLRDAKRRGSMDAVSRAVNLYGAVRPSKPIKMSSSSTSLSDSTKSEQGMKYSRSVPIFNTSSSPDFSIRNERLRQISENEICDGSIPSSVGSSQNPLQDNNNQFDKSDDDWVVLEAELSDEKDLQDEDDDVIPCDEIDEGAYTKVTWKVASPVTSHARGNTSTPRWNEYCMSKYFSSQSSPVCSKSQGCGFESPASQAGSYEGLEVEKLKGLQKEVPLPTVPVQTVPVPTAPVPVPTVNPLSSSANKNPSLKLEVKSENEQKTNDASIVEESHKSSDSNVNQNTLIITSQTPQIVISQCLSESHEPTNDESGKKSASEKSLLASSDPISIKKHVISESADDVTVTSNKACCENQLVSFSTNNLCTTPNQDKAYTSSCDSGVGGSDDDRSKTSSLPAKAPQEAPTLLC